MTVFAKRSILLDYTLKDFFLGFKGHYRFSSMLSVRFRRSPQIAPGKLRILRRTDMR
jgi:hypothetical protein